MARLSSFLLFLPIAIALVACSSGGKSLATTGTTPCDPVAESSQEITVTYAATTEDGRRLIVLEPAGNMNDANTRMFFGTADNMLERRISSVSRDHTIHVNFDLDGEQMSALLTFCGPSPMFGPPKIESAVISPAPKRITPLAPVAGSRAASCGDRQAILAAADAGMTLPLPQVASTEALVSGLRFFCL